MKKELFVIAFFLIFLISLTFSIPAGFAQNEITRAKASAAIDSAREDMQQIVDAGFSVVRINDSIIQAANLYDAQKALEEKTGSADYSTVTKIIDDISTIKNQAFDTNDQLVTLRKKLDELGKSQNMKEAEDIYQQAVQEFKDERYQQASEKIDECYAKTIELQATFTRLAAMYEASTKTLIGFVKKNYVGIIIFLAAIFTLYFSFRKKVYRYIIEGKMEKLDMEKEILNDLIRKTQEEYFKKGTLAEGDYRIRISKFAELIRDINRRIPMLHMKLEKEEELKKVEKEKRKEEEKKEEAIRKKIRERIKQENLKKIERKKDEWKRKERVEKLNVVLKKYMKKKKKSRITRFFEAMQQWRSERKAKRLEKQKKKLEVKEEAKILRTIKKQQEEELKAKLKRKEELENKRAELEKKKKELMKKLKTMKAKKK